MQGMELAAARMEERTRSLAIVETLAKAKPRGETMAELAHDARNMVTALALYCELLEEPGVLNASFRHYGSELRTVAEGSRRLLERMLVLDSRQNDRKLAGKSAPICLDARITQDACEAGAAAGPYDEPIADLREEVLANRNVLSALAGPSIALSVVACGGTVPVRLNGEELTRILVNLVRNAAEAIQGVGAIRIVVGDRRNSKGRTASAILTVEDSGRGIPEEQLEQIFDSGFTTRSGGREGKIWTSGHRGLGLSITRSIVEGAGGRIHAENRLPGGARFEIELPVSAR
jgi:signal transduction histidine kinase